MPEKGTLSERLEISQSSTRIERRIILRETAGGA
jgi:hypothetical protein